MRNETLKVFVLCKSSVDRHMTVALGPLANTVVSPLLRLLCGGSSKARQRAPLQALRVVDDGAIGSRAGNRWEAQVHKVSLLPGTERHTEQSA